MSWVVIPVHFQDTCHDTDNLRRENITTEGQFLRSFYFDPAYSIIFLEPQPHAWHWVVLCLCAYSLGDKATASWMSTDIGTAPGAQTDSVWFIVGW